MRFRCALSNFCLLDWVSQIACCGVQSHEREVVKLGPISMGERLRIGGDVSSDDDMDEATPSPPPSSPKRSHKRRVLPPRSIDSSEPHTILSDH